MFHRHAASLSSGDGNMYGLMSSSSPSPPDLRLRSEMWKGQLPIIFTLAPHEVTSMEDPPPIAMLVPRMSYFPLVLGDVRTHFRDVTPAMEDELWLEYEGIPLKWTIPIGVLFDLLCASSTTPSAENGVLAPAVPPMTLPWRITVHFQSFPANKLLRCKTLFTVRQQFLNTWKESCYLKFGTGKVALSCGASDHQKLWDSLIHLREDLYVSTNARIIHTGVVGASNTTGATTPTNVGSPISSEAGGGGGVSTTPNISASNKALVQSILEHRNVDALPIRIYVHCTRASHEEGSNSDTHMCSIQRAIKPKNKFGLDTTVADMIEQILPALIDPLTSNRSRPASPSIPAATTSPPPPSSSPHSPSLSGNAGAAAHPIFLLPNVRLLVQGFAPPLSTPLCWLSTYCSHPDSFLYFAVHIYEVDPQEEEIQSSTGLMYTSDQTGTSGGNSLLSSSGYMHNLMGSIGLGGFGGSAPNLSSFIPPSSISAAHNAVNVVVQNLPSISLPNIPIQMPSVPSLPSMATLFGGASAAPTAGSNPITASAVGAPSAAAPTAAVSASPPVGAQQLPAPASAVGLSAAAGGQAHSHGDMPLSSPDWASPPVFQSGAEGVPSSASNNPPILRGGDLIEQGEESSHHIMRGGELEGEELP